MAPTMPLHATNSSMESVGSNSPVSAGADETSRRVANRIIRALQHQLRLLHRAGAEFFVLGATGNVYTVTVATTPSCTCPDHAVPCKHILFVLLRVLGLSLHEACVWRQTLRPCQVARLVGTPTYPDVLAGPRAREKFHQLWSGRTQADRQEGTSGRAARADGAVCPVCLDEMAQDAALSTCGTCGNSLHSECFARWKRSRARRAATCVVCRARWRQNREQEQQQYMNLAAYMHEENNVMEEDGQWCAG